MGWAELCSGTITLKLIDSDKHLRIFYSYLCEWRECTDYVGEDKYRYFIGVEVNASYDLCG